VRIQPLAKVGRAGRPGSGRVDSGAPQPPDVFVPAPGIPEVNGLLVARKAVPNRLVV